MSSRRPLSRRPDFLRLWAAQGVSDFGARITREGLPMMAVMGLAATPAQLGLLAALSSGPALLVGLFAGGFVDRSRRRGLLIAADLARAAVLVALPLAALAGALALWQVYAAAALVAAASVLFDIADHAYLPTLLPREALTAGNARISATESVAEMGGPALAGLLFQWLTAPIAVAVNAATYLASAAFLAGIRTVEPLPEPPPRRRDPLAGLREGFAAARAEPHVRALLGMAAAGGFFGGFFSATYIAFALRDLHLTPALLGLAIACGGLAALVGSALAQPCARAFGVGGAILLSGAVTVVAVALIPLAPPEPGGGLAVLVVSQLLGDSSGVVAIVLALSLRQAVVPQRLLGRVGATFKAASGLAVVGALAGGGLAQAFGLRAAMLAAAVGLSLPPLIGLASPLRRLREIPPGGNAEPGLAV